MRGAELCYNKVVTFKKIVFFILILFFLIYLIKIIINPPICSSVGLQPVQTKCQCLGFEISPQYDIMSEGREAFCKGIVIQRTCYYYQSAREKQFVSCKDYKFVKGGALSLKGKGPIESFLLRLYYLFY